ncbi:MAG: hypothetical protein K9M08_10330 [Pirellula sp.]|nr:hypothetical protein [Pirellula sp.]
MFKKIFTQALGFSLLGFIFCSVASAQAISLTASEQRVNGGDNSMGFSLGDTLDVPFELLLDNTGIGTSTTFWVRMKWLGLDGNYVPNTVVVQYILVDADSETDLITTKPIENVSYENSSSMYTFVIEWGIGPTAGQNVTGGYGSVFYGSC